MVKSAPDFSTDVVFHIVQSHPVVSGVVYAEEWVRGDVLHGLFWDEVWNRLHDCRVILTCTVVQSSFPLCM